MRRVFWMALIAVFSISFSAEAQQARPDVSKLFTQLSQLKTTDRAARDILAAAIEDPNVLRDAAEKLPGMIDKPEIDEIWLNAVRLAGKLKVSETIPALQRAFDRGKQGIPAVMTMGTEVSLNDDIVAKALSQIGDPCLPALREFLKSTDPKMRRRAIFILRNIKSSASHGLLHEQLPIETDPKNQYLIQYALDSWD